METGVQDDVSQAYEKMFSDMECGIAEVLPGTIERLNSQSATDDDFHMLSMFMSSQWLRTMYFREQLTAMHADLLRKVLAISTPEHVRDLAAQIGKQLTDEDIKKLEVGEFANELNNVSHVQMIDAPRIWMFADMLYFKRWNIIRAEGKFRFITSDNPVAEWCPPPSGMFAAGFLERKHYFALTPAILLECVGPESDAPIEPPKEPASERAEYRAADDDETLIFNMLLAEHGGNYCYGTTPMEFNALLAELEHPGNATKVYQERYS